MYDYNELIKGVVTAMKDTGSDIVKLHGKDCFIRVGLEDGSLLIEIHNKETEELYNARYE